MMNQPPLATQTLDNIEEYIKKIPWISLELIFQTINNQNLCSLYYRLLFYTQEKELGWVSNCSITKEGVILFKEDKTASASPFFDYDNKIYSSMFGVVVR